MICMRLLLNTGDGGFRNMNDISEKITGLKFIFTWIGAGRNQTGSGYGGTGDDQP